MQLCSKCHKRLAVVFISKLSNNKMENEGFCIKCARELGIGQVDAIMQQYGISDDDIDKFDPEIENPDELPDVLSDADDDGKAPAIDFTKLFGGMGGIPPFMQGGKAKKQGQKQSRNAHVCIYRPPHKGGLDILSWREGRLLNSCRAFGDASL